MQNKTYESNSITVAGDSDATTDLRKRRRQAASDHGFAPEILDQLLQDYRGPEDLTGPGGLLKSLTAALVNRALAAEMDVHLGYEAGDEPPQNQDNRRNGKTTKSVRTTQGPMQIDVPRDREGSFEPKLIPKHQRHFEGFDDKIIAMYARGMSVRDIQAQLMELYGTEVSSEIITKATDAVLDELKAWRMRPLEPVYCVVYIDALVVKMRDRGVVCNKAVYLAVGLGVDGHKTVLGMWIESTEGAKYWMSVLTELRQRGLEDILVLCADGLTGLDEAVSAVYPQAIFQTCIVHMIRSSTRFVPWKDRKLVCSALREIYTAPDEAAALLALEAFEERYGEQYPTVAKAWRARWDAIVPFLSFPLELRKVIYTTNAIEALNRQLRKVLKTKGHLPSDDAAYKLIYLALRNAEKTWGRPIRDWARGLQQFAILFDERISSHLS